MSVRDGEAGSERAVALAAFVLLTLWFIASGFPRDELGAALLDRVEQATGAQANFVSVDTSIGWCLPTLRARSGRLVWPSGQALDVSYARVRPRLAWGWLIGRPRFDVKLVVRKRSTFKGWVAPQRGIVRGTLDDVVLDDLPYEVLGIRALRARGSGEASLSLRREEAVMVGSLRFRALDGVLTLAAAPLPIPFDSITGALDLEATKVGLAEELSVESPMGRLAARGDIARGVPDPGVNLEIDLDLREPALLRVLNDVGLPIPPGARSIRIGGTLSNPVPAARRR